MNVLDLVSAKVKMKKVASTYGGEWHGPCPSCGGNDRFHVWPEENQGQGGYWCRSCDKAGDAIQFLRDFENKTFQEACAFLNISIDEKDYKPPALKTKPEFTPVEHQSPAQLWQEKAEKLIAWAQQCLKENKQVMEWLAARGINTAALDKYRLGWNPGEYGKDIFRQRKAWGLSEIKREDGKPKAIWIPIGLVIPYISGGIIQRIRIRRPEGEPRYYVLPGSAAAIMTIQPESRAFVIVESELDAIAVAAACDNVGAVAVGSSHAKPDAQTYQALKSACQILNALDYDKAGASAMKWWDEQFPDTCARWPVPQGKDPGEAYQMGTDLNLWIKAGLPPVLTMGEISMTCRAGSPSTPEIKNNCHCEERQRCGNLELPENTPPSVAELYNLLRRNPGVKIINTPDRMTILRNGQYVRGRINELVFKCPEVFEFILDHKAEEIDGKNFINEVK